MKPFLTFIAIIALMYSCQKETIIPEPKQKTILEEICGTYKGKSYSTLQVLAETQLDTIDCTYSIVMKDTSEILLKEKSFFGDLDISTKNLKREGELIKFDYMSQSYYLGYIYLFFVYNGSHATYNTKTKVLITQTCREIYDGDKTKSYSPEFVRTFYTTDTLYRK